jgi:hypothetical protein
MRSRSGGTLLHGSGPEKVPSFEAIDGGKKANIMTKTSMDYWFPLIEKEGLPVPKTIFADMTKSCRELIYAAFDGKDKPESETEEPFFTGLKSAASKLGLPCFLRTSETSNKHAWKKSCFINSADVIPAHVFEIVEFSECCDFMGLPWEKWAVREFLPILPFGACPRYGDMPVNREFRFFVDGPRYRCHHPYWPLTALQEGGWKVDADEATAYTELCALDYETFDQLKCMASRAGLVCGGAWSVDFLETERGWFLTDMAEAHKSFHWEGCAEGEK